MNALIVSGDRHWTNWQRVVEVLSQYPPSLLVHGDADGLDRIARDVARALGWPEPEAHPADWKKFGRAAGPKRNQAMLDAHRDARALIAFHDDLSKSKGTRDMILRAKKMGIRVRRIKTVGEDQAGELDYAKRVRA